MKLAVKATQETPSVTLFESIEGKKGEQLAVALLDYLCMTSPACREAFVETLSRAAAAKADGEPLSIRRRWAARTEVTLKVPGECKRVVRVDMLIETDQALVAIEAKLFANWHGDQKTDYPTVVAAHANAVSSALCAGTLSPRVVLLVPKARRNTIEVTADWVVVDWESVLDAVVPAADAAASGITRFVAAEFSRFLTTRIGGLQDFDRHLPFLLGAWQSNGSGLQRAVLDDIRWTVRPELPNLPVDSRMSSSNDYLVQTASVSFEKEHYDYASFGFARCRGAGQPDGDDTSAFFIVTNCRVPRDALAFAEALDDRPPDARGTFNCWTRVQHCFVVDLETVGGSLERWSQLLTPFFDALAESPAAKAVGATGDATHYEE